MPDYNNLGMSITMGPKLRKLVENQLLEDLRIYGVSFDNLKFDWSESCIEGHQTFYLDGSVENFSSIGLYSSDDQLIAHGWMDFVHNVENNFFKAYWDLLETFIDGQQENKKEFGIPDHIWDMIPNLSKQELIEYRGKNFRQIP